MNRLIITLTGAGLGTILVPVSAHAGRIAFDRSGNLIVAEGNTILKFTPDGERSTFASGVGHTVELTFHAPSERDTFKKEQLAWLNQRNAVVQDAKKNAQENPTDAPDGEVTKMTLARTAELEKRLKKTK